MSCVLICGLRCSGNGICGLLPFFFLRGKSVLGNCNLDLNT